VLVDNFRPGTLEVGTAPVPAPRGQPRLIILRITGFGQSDSRSLRGIEAGFGGTDASRRQHVQQYLARFPQLRSRWRQAVDDATSQQGSQPTDLRAELTAERRRSAQLQQQIDTMVRLADLWRRKARRLERQLEQHRRRRDMAPPDAGVVVPLHPDE
jgi:hypothetical protein